MSVAAVVVPWLYLGAAGSTYLGPVFHAPAHDLDGVETQPRAGHVVINATDVLLKILRD